MKCYIYKSLKKDQLYLYLQKKDGFTVIPESLLNNIGKLEFVMELDITPERKLARVGAVDVMASLQEKGFFVQMPPIIVPTNLRAKNNKLH